MVEESPGARYHYLGFAAKRADLILVRNTTIDRYTLHTSSRCKGINHIINLLCQLASWRKDQRLAGAW
jgi:hypothetical protein